LRRVDNSISAAASDHAVAVREHLFTLGQLNLLPRVEDLIVHAVGDISQFRGAQRHHHGPIQVESAVVLTHERVLADCFAGFIQVPQTAWHDRIGVDEPVRNSRTLQQQIQRRRRDGWQALSLIAGGLSAPFLDGHTARHYHYGHGHQPHQGLDSAAQTPAAFFLSRSTRQVHSDARFLRPIAAAPIGRRTGSSGWVYSRSMESE
jgi:hypothetical protein